VPSDLTHACRTLRYHLSDLGETAEDTVRLNVLVDTIAYFAAEVEEVTHIARHGGIVWRGGFVWCSEIVWRGEDVCVCRHFGDFKG
jgi:hypothetical protein